MKYAVRSAVMPLLLGFGKTAAKTSWKLISKYGLVPTVLDKKFSLGSFLIFRKLPDSASDEILLMSLEKIADEHPEMTCVIIPCTPIYAKFISRNKALLESRFILRNPENACQMSPTKRKKD